MTAIRCCSACATPRAIPEGPCVCGSIQTLFMWPGAQRAVQEAYRVRLLAQARPLLPSTREERKDQMDRLFGKEGEC